MKSILSLNHLTVGYGGRKLLQNFSLKIDRGNFVSIVGSNGSGKTTLLKTILGIISPLSGQIERKQNTRFGYVSQRSHLNLAFPLTLKQVVMLGRTKRIGLLKRPQAYDHKVVDDVMAELNIRQLADQPIHTLSGGQFQRMLIARALACEPDIIVFDEPTTGMDIVAEDSFMKLVENIKKRHGLTVLIVTHDLEAAAQYSDTLVIINGTDRSVSVGPPSLVLTSKSLTELFHRPIVVENESGQWRVHLR